MNQIDTLCPTCGIDVAIDEDGCCASCGTDAHGDGVDAVNAMLAKTWKDGVLAAIERLESRKLTAHAIGLYHKGYFEIIDEMIVHIAAMAERGRPGGPSTPLAGAPTKDGG